MNLAFKHIASKIKNGMIYGFASGFFVGCFPNKLSVRFENTKYTIIDSASTANKAARYVIP